MKPKNQDEEEIRAALQAAFPKVERDLERDLWPMMLGRLQTSPPAVAWYDWALAASLATAILVFPKIVLMFAYYL